MRSLIKKQLSKIQYADLSNFSEEHSFIIPRRVKVELELNTEYIIEIADDLLIKGKNDILESNYNGGKIPEHKFIHGEVERTLGKLILFTGPYSDGERDIGGFLRGYLPKSKIKIIKKF